MLRDSLPGRAMRGPTLLALLACLVLPSRASEDFTMSDTASEVVLQGTNSFRTGPTMLPGNCSDTSSYGSSICKTTVGGSYSSSCKDDVPVKRYNFSAYPADMVAIEVTINRHTTRPNCLSQWFVYLQCYTKTGLTKIAPASNKNRLDHGSKLLSRYSSYSSSSNVIGSGLFNKKQTLTSPYNIDPYKAIMMGSNSDCIGGSSEGHQQHTHWEVAVAYAGAETVNENFTLTIEKRPGLGEVYVEAPTDEHNKTAPYNYSFNATSADGSTVKVRGQEVNVPSSQISSKFDVPGRSSNSLLGGFQTTSLKFDKFWQDRLFPTHATVTCRRDGGGASNFNVFGSSVEDGADLLGLSYLHREEYNASQLSFPLNFNPPNKVVSNLVDDQGESPTPSSNMSILVTAKKASVNTAIGGSSSKNNGPTGWWSAVGGPACLYSKPYGECAASQLSGGGDTVTLKLGDDAPVANELFCKGLAFTTEACSYSTPAWDSMAEAMTSSYSGMTYMNAQPFVRTNSTLLLAVQNKGDAKLTCTVEYVFKHSPSCPFTYTNPVMGDNSTRLHSICTNKGACKGDGLCVCDSPEWWGPACQFFRSKDLSTEILNFNNKMPDGIGSSTEGEYNKPNYIKPRCQPVPEWKWGCNRSVYGYACNQWKINDDAGGFKKLPLPTTSSSSFSSSSWNSDTALFMAKCQAANVSCTTAGGETCFEDPNAKSMFGGSASDNSYKAKLGTFTTKFGGCFSAEDAKTDTLPFCGSGNLLTPGDARISLSCRYKPGTTPTCSNLYAKCDEKRARPRYTLAALAGTNGWSAGEQRIPQGCMTADEEGWPTGAYGANGPGVFDFKFLVAGTNKKVTLNITNDGAEGSDVVVCIKFGELPSAVPTLKAVKESCDAGGFFRSDVHGRSMVFVLDDTKPGGIKHRGFYYVQIVDSALVNRTGNFSSGSSAAVIIALDYEDSTGVFLQIIMLIFSIIALIGSCYWACSKLKQLCGGREGENRDEAGHPLPPVTAGGLLMKILLARQNNDSLDQKGDDNSVASVQKRAHSNSITSAAAAVGNANGNDNSVNGKRKRRQSSIASGLAEDVSKTAADYCVIAAIRVVVFFFIMFKVMLNLSMIYTSLAMINVKVASWPRVRIHLGVAFPMFVVNMSMGLGDAFKYLNLIEVMKKTWNCGGAIYMVGMYCLVLSLAGTTVILTYDLPLYARMRIRQYRAGKPPNVKRALDKIAELAVSFCIYILQSMMIVCAGLVYGVFAGSGADTPTCDPTDQALVESIQVFMAIICVIFLLLMPGLFAGEPLKIYSYFLIHPYLYVCVVTVNLIRVLFACWDSMLEQSFKIVKTAEKYDDDPLDDDNLHETVLSIMGRSRGIFWIIIPGGIMLTKLSEALNDSTPLDFAPNLSLDTPRVSRAYKYITAIIQFISILNFIFQPKGGLAVFILLTIFPGWIIDTLAELGILLKTPAACVCGKDALHAIDKAEGDVEDLAQTKNPLNDGDDSEGHDITESDVDPADAKLKAQKTQTAMDLGRGIFAMITSTGIKRPAAGASISFLLAQSEESKGPAALPSAVQLDSVTGEVFLDCNKSSPAANQLLGVKISPWPEDEKVGHWHVKDINSYLKKELHFFVVFKADEALEHGTSSTTVPPLSPEPEDIPTGEMLRDGGATFKLSSEFWAAHDLDGVATQQFVLQLARRALTGSFSFVVLATSEAFCIRDSAAPARTGSVVQ